MVCQNIFTFILFFLGLALAPFSYADSPNWSPIPDYEFMERAIGKSVKFKGPAIADGVPNCVAAALRAGRYLPAFALSGTDSFYQNDLPSCFRKIDLNDEIPQIGDLGMIYEDRVPTLAHAVLFLGDDKIFEKPSPKEKDTFRYNSWNLVLSHFQEFALSPNSIRGEVWRFVGGKKCTLTRVNNEFASLNSTHLLRVAAKEIDQRILLEGWENPSDKLSKHEIMRALESNEILFNDWFVKLNRPFDAKRDWETYNWFRFQESVLSLLKYTPAYQ